MSWVAAGSAPGIAKIVDYCKIKRSLAENDPGQIMTIEAYKRIKAQQEGK